MQAQGRRTQPEVTTSKPAEAGASYRFLVRSAEEAVGAIRQQLGEDARVVSVRSVKAAGLMGMMGNTRLEVIAQVPAPVSPTPAPVAPADEAGEWRTSAQDQVPASPDSPVPVPSGARAARGPASVYGAVAPAATPTVALASTSIPAAFVPTATAPARRQPGPPRLEGLLRRSGLSE